MRDKCSIKERIKLLVNSMVSKAIADTCLMDISRLGISDIKCLIAAVFIGMMKKVGMKRKDIIHQMKLEELDVRLSFFAFDKFTPGKKEIF